MEELKVGDVVKLKSGGLSMTVEDIIRERVKCVYFDLNNQIQRQAFLINTVEITEDTGRKSNS